MINWRSLDEISKDSCRLISGNKGVELIQGFDDYIERLTEALRKGEDPDKLEFYYGYEGAENMFEMPLIREQLRALSKSLCSI